MRLAISMTHTHTNWPSTWPTVIVVCYLCPCILIHFLFLIPNITLLFSFFSFCSLYFSIRLRSPVSPISQRRPRKIPSSDEADTKIKLCDNDRVRWQQRQQQLSHSMPEFYRQSNDTNNVAWSNYSLGFFYLSRCSLSATRPLHRSCIPSKSQECQ